MFEPPSNLSIVGVVVVQVLVLPRVVHSSEVVCARVCVCVCVLTTWWTSRRSCKTSVCMCARAIVFVGARVRMNVCVGECVNE